MSLLVLIVVFILVLNIKVTTLQGINYQVQTIKIPLYLKVLDFFDRHYNYKQLVKRIIKKEKNDIQKIKTIFSWTYHSIQAQPLDLPIVDDHVWFIIVRGYGATDQSHDVFSTLCNYAGFDAFYDLVPPEDRESGILLSFVKIDKKWFAFDPYNGVFFFNTSGNFADLDSIKKNSYRIESIGPPRSKGIDYTKHLHNLQDIKEAAQKRARIQSPLKRLLYQLRKWL